MRCAGTSTWWLPLSHCKKNRIERCGHQGFSEFSLHCPNHAHGQKFDPDSQNCQNTFCRDRMARDCTIRHPVWPIVALQRRVRFSARLAGFGRGRCHQRRARRLNWPHFRFWSLISIFECHVCAKGGSGPLTRPCSVGKEATRGVQNRGQGYRGVAGEHVLFHVRLDILNIFTCLELGLNQGPPRLDRSFLPRSRALSTLFFSSK